MASKKRRRFRERRRTAAVAMGYQPFAIVDVAGAPGTATLYKHPDRNEIMMVGNDPEIMAEPSEPSAHGGTPRPAHPAGASPPTA
jgi:hypothetical protein